ncbi:ubiquitin-conjugating enzyme E2 T-like [Pararge aegeria]|uniref:Ubiquitin-conjugating enzyme E2 T n=2 Tax=Pararge aegeria TaxID=116150 RepID=A0A8S4R145_9NEOP|nr:ubiquitin-conjugating enzyme E2 T-like [Pararge aegeria]CAH2229376.1 jg21783 [Pararge aegeria aegeria]
MSSARTNRLTREIKSLEDNPPWGIICKPVKADVLDELRVKMLGPKSSPYEKGKFELVINVPDKYPFEPPQVKFITSVYHPNIDKGGRICMNMLKMPTKGSSGWQPTITIETLLISIQSLLANPNPDDPLMLDIAYEYKYDIEQFMFNATKHTEKHAV